MHLFTNDYSEGAHPAILNAVIETNNEQTGGYTTDHHCDHARRLILEACGLAPEDAGVEFIDGGTATNACALEGLLRRPYDSVVCAPSGHIATHEAGAIEARGHKVLVTSGDAADRGFVEAGAVDRLVREHAAFGCHMVHPQVIYVSDTTELGGVYTKAMLEELSDYAHSHGMSLYLDGARLGCALTSPANDLTLPEIAQLTDAFSIGGTKNGFLYGEALVIKDEQLRHDIEWLMKRSGSLMAKGRILGVQFETSFSGDLYWDCAKNANEQAAKLRAGLLGLGWKEAFMSDSNQLFFEVDADTAGKCCSELGCEQFYDYGETKVIRFVTSWATTDADVEEALAFLGQ